MSYELNKSANNKFFFQFKIWKRSNNLKQRDVRIESIGTERHKLCPDKLYKC